MVVYNHDRNAILAELIKICVAEEMLRAIEAIHNHLLNRGLYPVL